MPEACHDLQPQVFSATKFFKVCEMKAGNSLDGSNDFTEYMFRYYAAHSKHTQCLSVKRKTGTGHSGL
jgi:hypothetical protein